MIYLKCHGDFKPEWRMGSTLASPCRSEDAPPIHLLFFSLSLSFSTFFLNLHRFHFSEQGVRPLGTAGRTAAAVGAAVTGGAAAVLAAVGPPSGSSSPQWRNSWVLLEVGVTVSLYAMRGVAVDTEGHYKYTTLEMYLATGNRNISTQMVRAWK